MVKDLQLLQEIEEAHDDNVAFANRPKWDSSKQAASVNLIKEHF